MGLENIDLERQGTDSISSSSSLPRLQKDPFDIDDDDNDDIETLNNSKYSQVSKFKDEYDDETKAIKLKSYPLSGDSTPYLDDNNTLNDDDYMQHQPLNGSDPSSTKLSSPYSHRGRRSKRRSSYNRLPESGGGDNNGGFQHRRGPKPPRGLIIFLVVSVPVSIVIFLFILLKWTSPSESKNATPKTAPTGLTYPSGFNMKNNWGSLSPYFDTGANFPGIDSVVSEGIHEFPPTCKLKQVHVLHRHAERYPTTGSGNSMQHTAEKLKSMTEPPSKALQWLDNWNYTLGTELLVSKGVGTEFASGTSFWASHGIHLFNATENGFFLYDPTLNTYPNGTQRVPIVIRATSQSRIRNSASAWAAGFFGIYGDDPNRSKESLDKLRNAPEDVYKIILQTEARRQNSTLAGYFSCPNADNSKYVNGGRKMREWINIYLEEAVIRLGKLLPGVDSNEFKASDVFNLQNICSYETAAYGSSPFCGLFTEKEWRGYEYAADLAFYGMASHGTPVGAPEGAGWLYELLARLEKKTISPAEAGWGVNTTLTSSEDVFPTDQSLYLDMTHDSVVVSVLTALGLDILKEDLPSTKILAPRQFVLSRLTPFGARLYIEVLGCGEESDDEASSTTSSNSVENNNNDHDDKKLDESITNEEEKEMGRFASDKLMKMKKKLTKRGGLSISAEDKNKFIRIKLNNRVLPLGSLKECPNDKEGLCPLANFKASLKYALDQVDFDRNCYGIPEGYEQVEEVEVEAEEED